MKIRYYVCGLGYDKDNCVIDYECDFGDFDTYEEAYECFVRVQCSNPESLFTHKFASCQMLIQLEECEETDDEINCIDVKNECLIENPNFKEENNMKIRDCDVSLLIKECADFIYYTDEEEMDNDCSPEEQLLINSVANVLLAFGLIEEKEEK